MKKKKEKLIFQNDNGDFFSNEVLEGKYTANARGFGFVSVPGFSEDFFISESDSMGALDKDTVSIVATKIKDKKRIEAKVIKIVSRGIDAVVGVFEQVTVNYGFVIPDNKRYTLDIYVSLKNANGANDGDKVFCKITDFGTSKKNPEGIITDVLGSADDVKVQIDSVIFEKKIPFIFPNNVLEAANSLNNPVDIEKYNNRRDLRNLLMVTIDGEDSKDLDDAVSLTFEDGIYHLGVHIADVSEYVTEDSDLDKEAINRATSVYLPDRVIPMLPKELSNGICSLNEGENRLALSCLMDFNSNGKLIDSEIVESIIKTNARMTYTDINAIITNPELANNDSHLSKYSYLFDMFLKMQELSLLLRNNRKQRGGIDFNSSECDIIMDDYGNVIDIKRHEVNEATRLIEAFMLAANECVAETFNFLNLPFLYRIHEPMTLEDASKLGVFLQTLGLTMKSSSKKGKKTGNPEIHPKEIQTVLAKVEGTPEEALVSKVCLRSMQKAKYDTECVGHFGLALKYYTHFTSPIRRYPDLQIHRIIKEYLKGLLNEERIEHYEKILGDIACISSKNEVRAVEAERDADKILKAVYMYDHEGEKYPGVISGITEWGIYVELENSVEGMIPVGKLSDDYYNFDKDHYRLVGEKNGKIYTLGQKVNIIIDYVDLDSFTIDFVFAKEKNNGKGSRKKVNS